jgi:hypothetical protein
LLLPFAISLSAAKPRAGDLASSSSSSSHLLLLRLQLQFKACASSSISSLFTARSKMDWSAIALGISEQAGVDVSQHLPK